jgi:O-antigen/teichoic acid export membrane protein
LGSTTLSRWLSDGNLTRKAYLNIIASSLEFGARIVVSFVIIPLLVRGLGDYGYGVWQVLLRLIGYAGPASGHAAQTLKWTIANRQSSEDFDEKRRQVGTAIALWFIFLPLIGVFGGALAWFAPIWLDTPEEYTLTVRLASAVLVANLILVSLAHVPRSVLKGENLGYKRMGLAALLIVIGGVFTALALYLESGLVGVATATLATTVLTGIVFLQVTRSHVSWFGIARPSAANLRWFFGLTGWFLVWSVLMRIMKASDVVILGIADNPELVTVYTLTRYVPEAVITFIVVMVFGITPGLGGIVGAGDLPKAARVRNEVMCFTWLLVTAVSATTLLWNQSFVQLWVGETYYAGAVPTLLIIAMMVQFVLIRNDASIIDLTLDLRRKVLIGLVSTVLSILLAIVLVGYYEMGIVGLCVGIMLGRSILSFGYPWLIGHFFGTTLHEQLRSALRPVIVTVALVGVFSMLAGSITVDSWLGLAMSVAVTAAVTSLVSFYAGLSRKQRDRILNRARLVLASKPGG